MTTLKFHYKIMTKIKASIFLITMIVMSSCTQNKQVQIHNTIEKKDSLLLIKDTVIFGESTGGTEVKLFKKLNSNDSIMKVETLGEMGNSNYTFTFNKKMANVVHIVNEYEEPVSINSTPKTKNRKIESLKDSNKNELTNLFYEYKSVFNNARNKKNESLLNSKWIGNYSFTINEDSEDWRDTYKGTISIDKDSINFHVEGYQIDQNYKLSFKENGNKLYITYEKSLDNFASAVLNKNNDFGFVLFDGTDYKWQCPYLDVSFNDSKKQYYVLRKKQ